MRIRVFLKRKDMRHEEGALDTKNRSPPAIFPLTSHTPNKPAVVFCLDTAVGRNPNALSMGTWRAEFN